MLDIGSGSGYLTAIMAYMVRGQSGKALGIEHIDELTEKGVAAADQIPFAHEMLQKGTLRYLKVLSSQGYPTT